MTTELFGFPIHGMPYWQCHLDSSVALNTTEKIFIHSFGSLTFPLWSRAVAVLVARLLLLSNHYCKAFLKLRGQGLRKRRSACESSERWKGLMTLFAQAGQSPRPSFIPSPWSLGPHKAKWPSTLAWEERNSLLQFIFLLLQSSTACL